MIFYEHAWLLLYTVQHVDVLEVYSVQLAEHFSPSSCLRETAFNNTTQTGRHS